jgi:hypothetical protein
MQLFLYLLPQKLGMWHIILMIYVFLMGVLVASC